MNFQSLRRLQSKLFVAAVAAGALLLSSCGGGGATSSPNNAGELQLLPGALTVYAGVPYTATIVGGRKPYLVTSNEPTVLPLNFTTSSNEFSFVAQNPGVIDPDLEEGAVPRRTVIVQVRDSNGTATSNEYAVLQNFFTGYGESYSSTCTVSGGATTPPQACSGTDSVVTLVPVSNGGLFGNREFQFDRVRGDYQFVVEDPAAVPQLVNRLRVFTDHTGRAIARIRVNVSAPTQLATYTVTDVLTGATTTAVFLIVQQPVIDAITALPDTLTFTGALVGRCGSGSADVFVFGGTPPYSVSASAGLAISPTTIAASGGKVSVTLAQTPAPCVSGTVVITDSRGSVVAITVDNEEGAGTLPALAAAPTTIASLGCGIGTQVTAVGGTGPISATTQHPRISATVSGSTVTITRLTADPAPPYDTSGTVTITDGATIVTITITATPAAC